MAGIGNSLKEVNTDPGRNQFPDALAQLRKPVEFLPGRGDSTVIRRRRYRVDGVTNGGLVTVKAARRPRTSR